MNGNLQTNTCDADRLESYLNGELSEVQESEFTAHLDQCEPCRRSLELRAADPEAWSEAEQLLKPLRLGAEHLAAPRSRAPQIQQVLDALAPTDDPAMLGRLGGYEVSGVVGAGGMGVVLKAVDKSLDRTVAIKVMSPHLATSGGARKRFAREAKAAAAVLHANVIAIHGVSNDESLPYLVMPYIRGASLQKRLDIEGPLALTEILRIGSQIAAGLSAAHAQGLVHRDIKPANILLEDGIERVAITDFGLARAVDDATITRSGVIAGTPQYMSPEQARGESIDQRSDLFSLGSVLYAICTGRPPFRAETTFGVMRRITDDEPKSIREINPDIPDWLCVIIKRLMSKRAADRFESAEEVQELLEQCLAHVQQPDSVPLPESLVPQPSGVGSFFCSHRTGVIAMLGVFGFSLLGMLFWQGTEPPDIAGTWTGDEWGTVVLEEKRPGQYEGTYTETVKDTPGTIRVRWSRIERRYNGTWSEGEDRFGELSVRLVGDEIRGAYTTDGTSRINPGTPRLADLTWRRTDKNLSEQKTGSKRQRFEPVEGQADKTNWTVIPPPSFFSKTNWAVMARMTIDGEARIQLPEDKQPRCIIKLLKGSDEAITVQVQDAAKKSKTIVRIARDQSAEVTVDGDGYNINYPSVNVALDDLDTSPFAQVIVRRVENQGDTEVNGESSATASNEKARLQGLDEQELRELSKFPIHRVDDHDAPHVVSPPTPIEVIRELERNQGLKENSLTDLYERKTGNFRVIVEPVYDKVDPPRFLPLVGRASLHRVRFKCTVYYTQANQEISKVFNIDRDHLHVIESKTKATTSGRNGEQPPGDVPTPPVYGGRNPKTGDVELNPAWANPVRQMLAKANAIELTSGVQRLHCGIPDNVRGDARKLIGVLVALMPGGRIAWNPETAEIRLIEVDPASWRVAESLLPAAFEAIADPSVLEKPEKVAADDLDSHDPAELIAQVKHLRRISIENLLSDVPALYDTARWFWELSLSLEQEAELRTQARESASRAAKLRANGNEEEARASEARSEVLTAQAAALAAERKVAQRLRDTAEAVRDEAKLLAARISVFKEEGKSQEAEQLQQQLNQLLWKLDPDSFRVRDLQNRIIDARTSVNHQVADQLEAERRTLLKTLDERYPGTRQSDSAHGESSSEDISPQ